MTTSEQVESIEISSALNCFVYTTWVRKGDILTATNLHNGLWSMSFPEKEMRDFVSIPTKAVNKLAGLEVVMDEPDPILGRAFYQPWEY
jgi:hypothetical protein